MKTRSLISMVIIIVFLLSSFAYADYYGRSNYINGEKVKTYVADDKNTSENELDKKIDSTQNKENDSDKNEDNNKTNRGIGQELKKEIKEMKKEYKEGNYTGPMGRFLNVRRLSEELRELRIGNVSASTDLNISEEKEGNKTRITIHLRNGKDMELKIMPDTASEKAIARLKLKVCSMDNNCTIELKEMGKKVGYHMKAEKKAKILGLFETKMHVETDIDAETGDIVKVNKPWWALLASESEE